VLVAISSPSDTLSPSLRVTWLRDAVRWLASGPESTHEHQMKLGTILTALFVAAFAVGLLTGDDTLVRMLLINGAAQLVLFVVVAAIPFLRTGRMSYVDIAWPFGVALIGVLVLVLGDGALPRRLAVGAVYLFIGLRMGLAALVLGRATGMIFRHEFPRYQFRRMVLERSGTSHVRAHALAEVMTQGLGNASVLALPGLLMAVDGRTSVSVWEAAGLALWAAAYIFESTADLQKMRFVTRNRGGLCDVGLWRYSRHPNYFGQWLVWTGLVIAAVPSWWALRDATPTAVWIGLGIGAAGASAMLYLTLVYLTGAVPAEHFSVQKRPGYAAYQATTNRFFPWFPKPQPDTSPS
jgi:steroid 5-alpha reductase family enzyme